MNQVHLASSSRVMPDRLTLSAETEIDRSLWGIAGTKMGGRVLDQIVVVATFNRLGAS
jgi:hypothetical protein